MNGVYADCTVVDNEVLHPTARYVDHLIDVPRLEREVPGLNYRIPTPGLRVSGGRVFTSVELPGFTLRYMTDGSEPTGYVAAYSSAPPP